MPDKRSAVQGRESPDNKLTLALAGFVSQAGRRESAVSAHICSALIRLPDPGWPSAHRCLVTAEVRRRSPTTSALPFSQGVGGAHQKEPLAPGSEITQFKSTPPVTVQVTPSTRESHNSSL